MGPSIVLNRSKVAINLDLCTIDDISAQKNNVHHRFLTVMITIDNWKYSTAVYDKGIVLTYT